MSMSTLHVLDSIYLPGGTIVSQIQDSTLSNNFNELVAMTAGYHQPMFTGIMESNPDCKFRSTQLSTLLTSMGVDGASLTGGNTDFQFRKAVNEGTRTARASAAHLRTRATGGLLHWLSVSAQQGQLAEIDARLVVNWDGTNNPLVPSGSAALSGAVAADEQYTLGPVKLNGSFLAGEKDFKIETGDKLFEEIASGDLWPTFIGKQECNPVVITVTTREVTNWTTYGISTGTVLSNVTAYLRRKSPDGGNYANGSAQHIKFVCTHGIILGNSKRAGGNNPADTELRILLRTGTEGTNPFAITLATTIV